MSSEPLVSIWSITYNHAPYIRKCLDGILAQQTNFKFELIIGDDASTDGTSEILLEYAKAYPDIIKPIIQEENVGVRSNSLESVFPKLKGKYVAICEGDDFWTDANKLQLQVDFLENNPNFNLVFHNADIIEGDVSMGLVYNKEIPEEMTIIDYFKGFYAKTCTVLYRNSEEVRDRINRLPLEQKDDVRIFLSVIGPEGKYQYIDKVMSTYRQHDKGVWSKIPVKKRIMQRFQIWKFNYSWFSDYPGKKLLERKYFTNGLKLFWINFIVFQFNEAWRIRREIQDSGYRFNWRFELHALNRIAKAFLANNSRSS